MPTPEAVLTRQSATGDLEAAARSALAAWALDEARVTLLSSRVHATFRIDAAESSYVLRLYRPGVYGAEEIRSELAWLTALRADEGLLVPEPVATRDGARLCRTAPRDGEKPWHAALSRWMPGRVPDAVPDAATYYRFGEFMARLHRHGSRFRPPAGFERPRYDLDRLLGPPDRALPAGVDPALLSADEHRMLNDAAALLRPAIARLGEEREDFGLIHGDLQVSNQLLHEGEVGALDFVDCGWGYFLYDVAGALLPAWEGPGSEERREAFLRGYRRVRPLSPARVELLETFAVARALSVLRWSLENWHDPAVREPGETIVPHLKARIRHFLAGAGEPASTSQLLAQLRDRGIRLWAEEGRLRYKAAKGALTPELRARLAARKDEVLELLRTASGASAATAPPMTRVPREETMPTSFAQQRMWLLDQIDPGSPAYHIAQAVRLRGALRFDVLRRCLGAIVDRHEVLRTTFVAVDGTPRQVIAPACGVTLPVVDLGALASERREKAARRLATAEAVRPFDLARGPLARFTLIALAPEDSWLLTTFHHVVSDGWSNGILMRELTALYRAFAAGRPSPLAELPLQYADFACWQRRWLKGAVLEEQLAYWKEQLAGAPSRLELPTDRPRPRLQSDRGGELPLAFPPSLERDLAGFGQRHDATLFMTLLAGLAAWLHRHTGQGDLVIGSPIANRNRTEIEGLIGFFVNTLALRVRVPDGATFAELQETVRASTLGAYDHQDLPFEMLVDALEVERDPSYNPVFQVLFTLQNAARAAIDLPGLTLSYVDPPRTAVAFDLAVTVRQRPEGLGGAVTYNVTLFDGTRLRRMTRHLVNLLAAAMANPRRRISELPLMSAGERHQVLGEWSGQAGAAPRAAAVHELVAARAATAPDAVAVVAGGEALTYAHLEARATRLAHGLRALGRGAEDRIGVDAERSVDMVVALLGILKAGAAYVPLESGLPGQRLDFLCRDAGISELVTRRPGRWQAVAGLRTVDPRAPNGEPRLPPRGSAAADAAYVIYTSGSTGRPKGVVVGHGSLGRYAADAAGCFALTSRDRALQFASLSFDTSAEEIYPSLIRGATLVLRDEEMLDSPERFLAALGRLGVTVLNLPTAYWHELAAALDAGKARWPSCVRLVIIGGEAARPGRLERWRRSVTGAVRLLNTYGPTEATIVALRQWLERERAPEVPIGRPIAHARAYLFDGGLEPVPIGVPGELYLGGPGLARGYLGRAGLTARSFLPDPMSGRPGERLYRTGDRAVWLAHGALGFRGRVDGQVKVRGFRVELEEIEAVLCRHPAVDDAAVIAEEGKAGTADLQLIAFLVTSSRETPTVEELRRFLGRDLPAYMVPARYQTLESLPLTPSRKVDRRALAALRGSELSLEVTFTAPRTPLEEELTAIWHQLLERERIGVDDNFFDLGGNSLTATQLISRVRSAFEVELSLATFFAGPTVADLARSIEVARRVVADAAKKPEPPSFEEREMGEL